MAKDFGDILKQWDDMTGKSYGKQQITKNKRNKKDVELEIKKNEKKIHPIDVWFRHNGVYDKDSVIEESEIDYAQMRRRLRNMRCEAEIDLHGMTCIEAEAALNVFFEDAKRNGFKKVLITHGKGIHSESGGVLSSFVRAYLEKQKSAGETGHPKNADGGSGSTWVILKN